MSDPTPITIPLMDLRAQTAALKSQLMEKFSSALDATAFCLGPEVEAFEREFAAYSGAAHGVAMNSGTSALHLALRGLKPILVEKDYAGRHASGVNAGGVRQLARHLAEIPLSIASMALWEKIEELVGDPEGLLHPLVPRQP